jgi:hypothetical protein
MSVRAGYRGTQLASKTNRSFADVSQAILLTSRAEEHFPNGSQNGLEQGLVRQFRTFNRAEALS